MRPDELIKELQGQLEANIREAIKNKSSSPRARIRILADTQAHVYSLSKAGILGHLVYQMLYLYTQDRLNITTKEQKQLAKAIGEDGFVKDTKVVGIVKVANTAATNVFNELKKKFDSLAKSGPTRGATTKVSKGGTTEIKEGNEVFVYTFRPTDPSSGNTRIYKYIADQQRPVLEKALKPILELTDAGPGDIFNIGHMFNSTASTIGTLQELVKLAEARGMSKQQITNLKSIITKSANKNTVPLKEYYAEKKLNLNYKRRLTLDSKLYAEHNVLVELQSAEFNQEIKELEAKALALVRNDALNYLAKNWYKITGSPTDLKMTADHVLEDLVDGLDKALGNPTRFNKSKRKRSGNKKSKNIQKKGKRGTPTKPKLNNPIIRAIPVQEVTLDLISVKNIINEHLPEYVKANMGKGSATEVLNWRTGRFSSSAEVLNLFKVTNTKATVIEGLISYMRSPYDVFRPGGKLHKPGRDPKKLIDKSIRQILKDKALVNLTFRSKVN